MQTFFKEEITQTEKEKIQTMADNLADLCLANCETYNDYTDADLVNAIFIFSHFLMDMIYKTNQHLSFEKQCDLAETVGKAIRELIKSSTGKDMHELVKK